jgi:mRNA-degrading endonuclease RelE of RelBE toxin-antitoxin system
MGRTMAADKYGVAVASPDEPFRMIQVDELASFQADAAQLLTPQELVKMIDELATLRQLGNIISGTGGLRKFRWGAKGKGKRGGVRVIYYYGGEHMPIYLIAIYGKNEKADMTGPEKKAASKLAEALAHEHQHKRPKRTLQIVRK